MLAYLLPGNTFGELGILENKPRSATVQALTEVEVLSIERESFIRILHEHPSITIELAKLLGHYLTESNKRLTQGGREKKVIFIIDRFGISDAAALSRQLAIKLKNLNERNTVLAEYPGISAAGQQEAITFGSGGRMVQEKGIDILNTYTPESKTNLEKLALFIDNLLNHYDNLVILLKHEFARNPGSALDSADQVILLGPTDVASWSEVVNHQKSIKNEGRLNSSQVLSIMINTSADKSMNEHEPDLEIRLNPNLPKSRLPKNISGHSEVTSFNSAAAYLADRLHRDNQIGIFIPSIRQDGTPTESAAFVDKTLDFLGKRFGGATCEEVKGVWNSHESGIVGEKVFKIYAYISAADLRKHMGDIVDFVRIIKGELRQEAMALEINHRLTLL
ncbi:MAG: cyclic nucleotide-binding domain-containing protein [Cyclobacteriaceae bacterium]|nr:cyclic nucleotide-binding domain-containing protein [Cyclobacteriaceae bacterium]